MVNTIFILLAAAMQANALVTDATWFYSQTGKPLVIGHRGSLGHFPEHTLAGYTDAWLSGVDYVELDLQMTSDGVVVANHDECLKDSTNAVLYDQLWKARQKNIVIPASGHVFLNDYPVPEFTVEEVRMLKRRQRMDYRSTTMDGLFTIPTFEEVIKHMYFMSTTYDRSRIAATTVPGLYIELKEPQWYLDNYGIDMGQEVFSILEQYGLSTIQGATDNGMPIIIQSFNEDALKRFATLSDLPLVQLMSWSNTYDFDHIATYAHGVGPDSKYVMYWPDSASGPVDVNSPSEFIEEMHDLELMVHPYTLRDDDLQYTTTPAAEISLYATKGVDGIFCEFVSTVSTVFEKMYPTTTSNYRY